MESLRSDLHNVLLKRPRWVFDRTLSNVSKYLDKTLVSKYSSSEIDPLSADDVVDYVSLDEKRLQKYAQLGDDLLRRSGFAYFVMAGGVATSMGGCIKALITAKDGKSFIEIKLDHVRAMQKKYHCTIPVIIMTNDETDSDIMSYLGSNDRLSEIDLIKIVQPVTVRFSEDQSGLSVARLKNGNVSNVPGGHYDAFILLNDIRDELLERKIRTIFVNNIDNLGATIDPALIGCHIACNSYFTPEVARKEKNEKGGVFARIGGELRLLEGPMVPEDYYSQFNDSEVHKYFNTNSIYIETAIFDYFEEIDQQVPAFINRKEFDGIKQFGFESAIGLVFGIKDSAIIAVDRSRRFCPVKFLSDLWILRSNFYVYDRSLHLVWQAKTRKPQLTIPATFLGNVADIDAKISEGGKSTDFLDLISLDWKAKDGRVGKNVAFSGTVVIDEGKSIIKDNSRMTG